VPNPGKRTAPSVSETDFPPGSVLGFLADRSQLDFEVDFYQKVLSGAPSFTEVAPSGGPSSNTISRNFSAASKES